MKYGDNKMLYERNTFGYKDFRAIYRDLDKRPRCGGEFPWPEALLVSVCAGCLIGLLTWLMSF
jgi:hypothetical protein